MTRADLIVRNGIVVTSEGRREADLAIRDGAFVAIAPRDTIGMEAADEYDASGRHVLPGVIEGHVQFREPGMEHKEDWQTGSRAAVMGGVTTVIDMPNTIPPTATVADARSKLDLAGARSHCDFGLIGLLAADHLDELEPMARHGLVIGFKAFLGPTVGDIQPPDDDTLVRGMRTIAGLGLRLGFHAEDGAPIERLTADLRAAGRSDPLAHLEARPVEAEVRAIERAGEAAGGSGARSMSST